ncbi:MAG: hypothetical protein WCE58_02600 [Gallionella sp.]
MTRPGVDFDWLIVSGQGHLVEINPVTGNRQYHWVGNDVFCVVEIMGGKESVAAKLGVEEIEIEHWIDDHYVPTRYAEMIHKLTGWSVWSIQVPAVGGIDVIKNQT